MRPRSVRFVREQDEIDRWMNRALVVAPTDQALAIEIVKLQHVLKGYGSTYEHGGESFAFLMAAADTLEGTPDAGPRLAELHEAALADESGDKLQEELADLEAAVDPEQRHAAPSTAPPAPAPPAFALSRAIRGLLRTPVAAAAIRVASRASRDGSGRL